MRDDLDIARERVLKAQDSEDKLKKYMKKAEETTDLKQQIKNLEEQMDTYLKRALDAGMFPCSYICCKLLYLDTR